MSGGSGSGAVFGRLAQLLASAANAHRALASGNLFCIRYVFMRSCGFEYTKARVGNRFSAS